MKHAIVNCLAQMMCDDYGAPLWEKAATQAGATPNAEVLQAITTEQTMHLFDSCIELSGLERSKFYHRFGQYWSNEFAPNHFRSWFIMSLSAKDFSRQLDRIYAMVCPPDQHKQHIEPQWIDNNTLRLKYHMQPGQIELFVALAQGIAGYYQVPVQIETDNGSVTILHF